MARVCVQCSVETCYRWYKGPLCANCYRRNAYKANPERTKAEVQAYRLRNPERNKAACKRNYLKNRDRAIQAAKEWAAKNREKVKEYSKTSTARNQTKIKQYQRAHYQANKHLYRAKDAKYRAHKLNATPPWADLEVIAEFYRNCPKDFHVDHIIPLQGENVCGLHVIENLQYLPARENLSKGNRYVA